MATQYLHGQLKNYYGAVPRYRDVENPSIFHDCLAITPELLDSYGYLPRGRHYDVALASEAIGHPYLVTGYGIEMFLGNFAKPVIKECRKFMNQLERWGKNDDCNITGELAAAAVQEVEQVGGLILYLFDRLLAGVGGQ